MRRLILLFLLLVAVAGGLAWQLTREPTKAAVAQAPASAATASAAGTTASPAVPILAGVAEQQDLPIYLSGIGTVQAFNTVTVKARVDGQLDKILFTEGQEVKEGDVLAQIDPRPLQAALGQALATRARDQAQLANAKLDLQRYSSLSTREFATKQSVDTQTAMVAQLEAALQGDQATIDNAKVQLGYTTIAAPLTGRTGMRLIDQGNIVHAGDASGIVVITQLQPISVIFTLPQDVLGDLHAEMAKGALKVFAFQRDDKTQIGEGTLALVDNQIDQTTGTIRLKAVFANADNALWPGEFVNARLLLTVRRNAVTVPATVVQRGPNGTYAYVIKPDSTVEPRPIKTGQMRDGVVLVEDGLAAGERVVVDGQYKLRPGMRVDAGASTKVSSAATKRGD